MQNPPNTTPSSALHVVLGGRGGAGETLARLLHATGRRVRVLNRSGVADLPPGIEVLRANLLEPSTLTEAVRGAAVVHHTAGVPYMRWAELLPKMLEGAIFAARSSGARLIYLDNLYMYGRDTLNMRPEMPEEPVSRKGALRAQLGKRLLEAHRACEVRATIARAADFYGPRVYSSLLDADLWRGMLSGKAARWAGRLDVPHAMSFIEDVARALALLASSEEAEGQVWTVPTAQALTGRQFLELAAGVAGQRPKIQRITRPMVALSGLFNPMHREFSEMLYQFERPFTVDGSRFAQTFGFLPTPHRAALETTLSWVRSERPSSAALQTA